MSGIKNEVWYMYKQQKLEKFEILHKERKRLKYNLLESLEIDKLKYTELVIYSSPSCSMWNCFVSIATNILIVVQDFRQIFELLQLVNNIISKREMVPEIYGVK